jgi:hypothetical protein
MSDPKPKITFLVGAGLVYDAGLPLSNDLTMKFRNHLREQVEINAKDNTNALLLQVYRFLVGGIRYQQGVLNRDPDGPVNIEQLATAALRLKSRLDSPLAPYVSGWNQKLVELESKKEGILSDFLEAIYSRLNSWLTVDDAAKIAYLARLNDFKANAESMDIFSLNYDLCIERAFMENAHAFVNGFTESGWTPSKFQTTDIRLFKMHGSLDWVEDEVHGICSVSMPRHAYADDFEGQKPPLLIFGTDAKLTGKEPFLTLLHSFSSRLHDSDVLIVVGYSFQDDYLNEIVEQRMNRNTRLKIIVVSPKATDVVRKVKFLNGSPRVKTIDAGAKEALNDGHLLKCVREVSAKSTDETPFA